MSSEGNGSTGVKFSPGLIVPSDGVWDSTLVTTQAGRDFATECLNRHSHGDWGDIPPWFAVANERSASDAGIAAGGLVVGIYPIPEVLNATSEPDDRLICGTTTVRVSVVVGVVVTFVLFLSER
jgi:hypothetical protein